MKLSDDPEDVIVTYSLGSCIGLSLLDAEARVGGLIHCLLSRTVALYMAYGRTTIQSNGVEKELI